MEKTLLVAKVPKVAKTDKGPLYIVTNRITGNINGKQIDHIRGDKVYFTSDEAKVFKDSILEI